MKSKAFLVIAALFLAACATTGGARSGEAPVSADEVERSELYIFLDGIFERRLSRSPQFQTYLNIKTDYDKWDDISDEKAREDHQLRVHDLAEIKKTFGDRELRGADRLSYELFVYDTQERIDHFKWRFHNYPVNQMYGIQSKIPAFLIGQHKIESLSDAEAYIARLKGMRALFAQGEVNLKLRESKGILAPAFVFPWAIADCNNVLKGAPFQPDAEDSTILADFKKKVVALKLDSEVEAELVSQAEATLLSVVEPAYRSLLAVLEDQATRAKVSHGVWHLPEGEELYRALLRRRTTLDMSADEVHELGLKEVAGIHAEMQAIMKTVGYEGTLQEFFEHMRTDERFYFPEGPAGREEYLALARDIVAKMTARLDEVFLTKPSIPLEVRPVEAYREKSAGKAFYRGGAPDGTRPGIFYANLANMKDMPRFELEALVYHEALPGHHMQVAIAQRLDTLPRTRRFSWYTAYGEGWGLYSEHMPKEMGFYSDPYSDFGRLAMRLWRACRLVVDTGIHHQKWSREKAIEYLMQNTAASHGQSFKAIERYFVMPGQATAYMIGMLKILELREKARAALGERFDIRVFHELVLTNGPVPLPIMEREVDRWIARGGTWPEEDSTAK